MIPCAEKCSHYCEGCHKTCPQWSTYVQGVQKENRARSSWLYQQNKACLEIIRSYRSISPCRNYK